MLTTVHLTINAKYAVS